MYVRRHVHLSSTVFTFILIFIHFSPYSVCICIAYCICVLICPCSMFTCTFSTVPVVSYSVFIFIHLSSSVLLEPAVYSPETTYHIILFVLVVTCVFVYVCLHAVSSLVSKCVQLFAFLWGSTYMGY